MSVGTLLSESGYVKGEEISRPSFESEFPIVVEATLPGLQCVPNPHVFHSSTGLHAFEVQCEIQADFDYTSSVNFSYWKAIRN